MATEFCNNLKSLTIKMITAGMMTLPRLSVVAVALFLFVSTAHANVFVSDFGGGKVKLFDDSGNYIRDFATGLGSSEGIACAALLNNTLYVANNTGTVYLFDLTTGVSKGSFPISGASSIAAMTFSTDGSILYVASYVISGTGNIFGVNPTNGTVIYHVATPASHDIRFGPDNYVYATDFQNATGVVRFSKDLSTSTQFVANNDHGLSHPGGMAFDGLGNLWVTNFSSSNGFISEYQNSGGISTYIQTVMDLTGAPLGLDLGPDGDMYVANFNLDTISKIDIAGGTYVLSIFINSGSPGNLDEPKYVNFSENCCDTGYVEICKQSNPTYPVMGIFDFTATAGFFTSETVQVPVGDCSGALQVPSGAVTITETPVVGILVSNVTAYSYNDLGIEIPELRQWTAPDLDAIVGVVAGDVSLGTIATFTNYTAPQNGQLKVCKIAGPQTPVGAGPFNFTTTGAPNFSLLAGPADQGGYCQLVNTYPVNTPVTITEVYRPTLPYQVAPNGITVECNGCTYTVTIPRVTTTIGAGITEVDFTNIPKTMPPPACSGTNLLTNGSFETGDFTGWTTGGNFTNTYVVSGPFYPIPGAEDGTYYAALGPAGSDGTLSQSITTTQGQTYHVCFWLWANWMQGDMPSDFKGSWDGTNFLSLNDFSTGSMWKQYVEGAFTGTGHDTLTFSFRDDSSYIGLDNVMVTSP